MVKLVLIVPPNYHIVFKNFISKGFGRWIVSIIKADGKTFGDSNRACDTFVFWDQVCDIYVKLLVNNELMLRTKSYVDVNYFSGTYQSRKMPKNSTIKIEMWHYDVDNEHDKLLWTWTPTIDNLEKESNNNYIIHKSYGHNEFTLLSYWQDDLY